MRKKRGFIDIQNMKPRFTFIFPCPLLFFRGQGKIKVGREKKIPRQRREITRVFWGKWECHRKRVRHIV